MDWQCCHGQCGDGEGDCDYDSECEPLHICDFNNCKNPKFLDKYFDCCKKVKSTAPQPPPAPITTTAYTTPYTGSASTSPSTTASTTTTTIGTSTYICSYLISIIHPLLLFR